MYTCSHCGAFIDDPDEIYCPECSAYFEPGELMRRGAPEEDEDDEY